MRGPPAAVAGRAVSRRPVRVAVADDSAFIRKAIARILDGEPGFDLVGAVACGEELLESLDRFRPDAIVLDLSMPGMGGLPTLDLLMRRRPTPVLILSTHSRQDAPQTIEALHRGALDFIDKQLYSLVDFEALRTVLVEKLRLITGTGAQSVAEATAAVSVPSPAPARDAAAPPFDLLLLGASTGGPPAIERILTVLAADVGADLRPRLAVPVAVVQHMPAGFTRAFADRLNAHLALSVREAVHGEPLVPGTVYIAPGGLHLRIAGARGALWTLLGSAPATAAHRPSIDVLFASVAAIPRARAAAVVLTGMGRDGAAGTLALERAGAHTIAEDERSAVVYGMPRAAVESGGVNEILELPRIGPRLLELLGGGV